MKKIEFIFHFSILAINSPIRLSDKAVLLIIAWIAVLFCWEEFIAGRNNKDNEN